MVPIHDVVTDIKEQLQAKNVQDVPYSTVYKTLLTDGGSDPIRRANWHTDIIEYEKTPEFY